MFTIPRNLVRQVRSVFRRALGVTSRSAGPAVAIIAGPKGLRIRCRTPTTAAEYHLAGDLPPEAAEPAATAQPPETILVPFELLVRYLGDEARQAVQETVANSFAAFARLVELGKQEVAHATPLARFAVAQVASGRKVGGRLNGRDVLSPYAQRRNGIRVSRLDRTDGREDGWREIVVEDRRAGPDHVAMVRLDFAAWLKALPLRNRRIAEALETGEQTREVARQFGLSPDRVSQLRRELHDDWETFQGEALSA